jgi:hypothetical protein
MRRVVVTPTFAAGLGVVVAALLAYPVQTVFSYVAPGATGRGGMSCGQDGCSHAGNNVKPAPFGLGGGVIPSPSRSAKRDDDGAPGMARQQAGGNGGAAIAPRLSYKITSRWQGGFRGQVTLTFPGAVPSGWHLRIGYPGGHIVGVNPNGRLAANGHAATVRSSDYARGSGPGGRIFTVGVGVQGMPGHPPRCSFDGQICHFG